MLQVTRILIFSFVTTTNIILASKYSVAELPRFRILAPQLICPKDENSPIETPDYTVISIQTKSTADFRLDWTVRWDMIRRPTQRFTLMIWRTVRALEAKLNGPQPEPFVYVINDDELLYGVNYIFNVTAITLTGERAKPKSFYINNTFGDPTLEAVDERTDGLSVIIVGGQTTYVDIGYVVEAEVTMCVPMYDYHFLWKVHNPDTGESLNISATGSRLEIAANVLKPGLLYDVTCYILKESTEEIMTQIELPFEVGYRGLEVYLNVDRLIVGIYHSFSLESIVINHDYFGLPLTFQWLCYINGRACDFLETANDSSLIFPSGLPATGQYEITVIVGVLHQSAQANATITALDSILPVIEIVPTPRILNEGTTVTLVANVSNVMPICLLTWYFATDEELLNISVNNTIIEHELEHGTPIADTITVNSLEENFLSELTDYTNETEWRQVTAVTAASAGRARIVSECNCSVAYGCGQKEIVFADVHFELNKEPVPDDVMVSPSSGTALETVFRVSTRPASDPDEPLRYTFYCSTGNNGTLVLGSYLEHLAVDTLLPYVEGGTDIWVEVCDILGACSKSEPKSLELHKGEARSMEILMAEVRGHIKRCEIILLQRVAIAAIVTYTNAGQTEPHAIFTAFLLDIVPTLPRRCVSEHQRYLDFLSQLTVIGLTTK